MSKKNAKYTNIFFQKVITKLLVYIKINNYLINLEKGKQLLYGLIHSFEQVKLIIFKSYIKVNLKNKFIKLSKLPLKF